MLDKIFMPIVAVLNLLGAVGYVHDTFGTDPTPGSAYLAMLFTVTAVLSLSYVSYIFIRPSK
jgi:hypothetical protein